MECSICLDAINAETGQVLMSCGHPYHLKCISDWLHNTKACPLCRAKPCTYEIKETDSDDASSEHSSLEELMHFRNFDPNVIYNAPPEPEPDIMDGTFSIGLQALFNSDEHIDVSVFSEEDLNIVVTQASVSHRIASMALTSAKGDVVDAIIELTSYAN